MPKLLNAPPLPEELFAPDTFTPEMDKSPPKAMLKILKLPLLPLMLRLLAPIPVMITVPAEPPETEVFALRIVGNAPARVMV